MAPLVKALFAHATRAPRGMQGSESRGWGRGGGRPEGVCGGCLGGGGRGAGGGFEGHGGTSSKNSAVGTKDTSSQAKKGLIIWDSFEKCPDPKA